jgi:hypothetical protein
MKVRYLPEADAEYQAAVTWYEEHSGAAEAFIAAIERAERTILALREGAPAGCAQLRACGCP